jgi:hypothetical protein
MDGWAGTTTDVLSRQLLILLASGSFLWLMPACLVGIHTSLVFFVVAYS